MTREEKRFLRRELINRGLQHPLFELLEMSIFGIRVHVRTGENSLYNQSLNIYSMEG